MMSRVNLVAILLTLSCVSRALEHSRTVRKTEQIHRGEYPVARSILREEQNKLTSQSATLTYGVETVKGKIGKQHDQSNALILSKNNVEKREHPRRRKRKMDRTLLALLMAYKLKFIALIPTMLGGLVLLKATALLAGFFFALFAAVLGLKIH